jgi:hypothetical protein
MSELPRVILILYESAPGIYPVGSVVSLLLLSVCTPHTEVSSPVSITLISHLTLD